jgi:hypothetical protein
MNIEQVSKTSSEGLETADVIRTFSQSESLQDIRDAVRNAKDRLFMAWSSVDVVDKDGEKIPIDEVIETHRTALQRGGSLQNMHTNHKIGCMLAYRTMTHPVSNTVGVLQLNRVFSDYELDDQVWNEIKDGKRTGLSLGGYNTTSRIERKNGKLFKVLAGFRNTETSSVYSPANPLALNEAVSAVAKSESQFHDKYVVVDDEVYKITKVGETLTVPMQDSSQSVESDTQSQSSADVASSVTDANVLNEVSKKETEVTPTMTQQDVSKADILGVAIQKMEANETLSEEEKSALKSAVTAKTQATKQDKDKDVEKADSAESISDNGKDQPASPAPAAANAEDVAKAITAQVLKAVDAKFAELTKSIKAPVAKGEKVGSTPAPEAGEAVSKTEKQPVQFNPAQIAKGEVKMSWTQLNQQIAKAQRGQ